MSTPRSEFLAGARAELPILLGDFPFGLIYGALAIQLGVPAIIAQAMSSVIFAGSAQFISTPLLATATPALVVIMTVFVINLRHALYSASLAPYMQHLKPLWKVVLAYLLTDEAYVVAITHYQKGTVEEAAKSNKQWYFLGAGVTLWVSWQIVTAIGLFIGGQVPPELSLDFALPLTFIALVVPNLKTRAHWAAAIVAGIVGVAAFMLPYKLGLILAAALGITAGMVAEKLVRGKK
jgi:4-azaleucine resistance transporter AzlC